LSAAYVDYDLASAPYCAAPDGRRDFCGPEDFEAQPSRLYRNNGDGTFTYMPDYAGASSRNERGLGVLIADLTGDRILDVYEANDGGPGWLLANRGNLRFSGTSRAAAR
jgi:enediyne biosynthesis protein E4